MARKKTIDLVMYLHPQVQELQIDFYKEKMKARGFKDYWNVFKQRKGISEGTYENWRREFTRKVLLKAHLVPHTRKINEENK